jgi:ABC-type transport system involved in multi-copper enzyme maturation permease subunit
MIVAAALLPLALLVGLIAGQAVVDPPNAIPWTRYVMSAVGLFTLLLAVGGLTLLLATGAQRRGLAVARAVGVILTVYVAEVFADLRAGLDVLHWTSPFHYYDPIRSAVAGVTPARNFLILLGVFGVTTTLAFFLFERRDV